MPNKFSLRKLFRPKTVGNPEAQNDRNGPTTDVSEMPKCEAETSMAPELSRPQNLSVTASASADEDRTKVASSSVAKPQDPPKLPVITDAQGTPASPDAGTINPLLLASAVQETSKASSSYVAQAQGPPSVIPITDAQAVPAVADPQAKEPQPATKHGVQQDANLSQTIWNEAYESLEGDEGKLVKAYVEALTKLLEDKKATDTSAAAASDVSADRDLEVPRAGVIDISAELKDRAKRQMYMEKLVKEGQAKVSKASKITKGVGVIADTILSAKPVIDLAIQNIPQAAPAALPWAGVCIGLQASNRPYLLGFRVR
jgi:hypothetical protein